MLEVLGNLRKGDLVRYKVRMDDKTTYEGAGKIFSFAKYGSEDVIWIKPEEPGRLVVAKEWQVEKI